MEELQTQRAYEEPRALQFSIFMDNRVGKLKGLLQLLADSHIRLVGLAITDSIDCAIVRCILAPSDDARAVLKGKNISATETELVVVELAGPDTIRGICESLIKAEVNIHYVYMLMLKPPRSAVALHVDEPSQATTVLLKSGFALLGEDDLK